MLQEQTISGDTCLTYAMKDVDQLQNFHVGMLATNPTLRAVPFHCTYVEGTAHLIYKTHSLVPVNAILERGQGSNLVKIIKALGETIEELMRYQLMPENMVLNEKHIYMDSNAETIYLIYLPLTIGNFDVKSELTGLLIQWMETYLKTSQQMTHPLFIQLLLKLRQPQIVLRTLVELMTNDIWSHELEASQVKQVPARLVQDKLSTTDNSALNLQETSQGSRKSLNKFTIKKQPKSAMKIDQLIKSDRLLYAMPAAGLVIAIGVVVFAKIAMSTKLGIGLIVLSISLLGYQKLKSIGKDKLTQFKSPKEKVEITKQAPKILDEVQKYSEVLKPTNHYSEETVMLRSLTPTAVLMLRGEGDSKFYSVIKEITTIGRNPSVCDLVIEETGVGRIHAEVHNTDQKFYIKDLQSLNGTIVNGRRITSNQYFELKSGDQIKIGQSEVIFT